LKIIQDKEYKADPWIKHKFVNQARSENDREIIELHHWSKVKEKDEIY